MPNTTNPPLEKLSKRFRAFAEDECKHHSQLYYQLAHDVSKTPYLLSLAAHCAPRQPVPNLFFAAIHYLLLKSQEEVLADYYPSICKKKVEKIPIELFNKFCQDKETTIIAILKNKIVQTNTINRTAYLMPIFSSCFKEEPFVNLVDIGCSSGLTMNFDLYTYDYGIGQEWGNSDVKIKTNLRAGKLPYFKDMVTIKRKIGIDQNPLDLNIEDNAIWLKSLIWPDLSERFNRLAAAIGMATQSQIELYQAHQTQQFRKLIQQIPSQEALAVYHTHVLYQFSISERTEFWSMLDQIGQQRDFIYLAVEGNTVFDPTQEHREVLIQLTHYKDGKKRRKPMGQTDGHATWIKWGATNGTSGSSFA
ncbi:MAG: DUF2332 domain-containing protein [Bacteroidota bacterium]